MVDIIELVVMVFISIDLDNIYKAITELRKELKKGR